MLIGINVGSGQRRFESITDVIEWFNVDKVPRQSVEVGSESVNAMPDIVCDGRKMPIEDGVADYVVLHHVLEHFGCGEGIALLNEAFRVLRHGGCLIVCVPNMKALALRWISGKMDDQLYFTNVYGAYMGDEEDRHKWGFTKESLRRELSNLEWRTIREHDWREIPGANIARDWWILALEATK